MSGSDPVEAFLAGSPFAVVGASTNRAKFGNRILRCYLEYGFEAHPVNPRETIVEGLACAADLATLPERPHGVSIITPPAVTLGVVREALDLGIQHLWMQPGAEDPEAVEAALAAGVNLLWGGVCLLVELPRRKSAR